MSDMKEFDPGYMIDRFGNVWRQKNDNKIERVKLARLNGYPAVYCCGKDWYVHRLVGNAFIPNPDNKPCINHKDGDKTNNNVENLAWVTYAENNQHAYDTGLKVGAMLGRFGADNCLSKPVVMMDMEGNVVREFAGLSEAWRETGVSFKNISAVCKGRKGRVSAGGYRWAYAD